MTENKVLQIFLRLLHKEQQEYPDEPEKRKRMFSKIVYQLKRGKKL